MPIPPPDPLELAAMTECVAKPPSSPIADMRGAFARKTPQASEDRAQVQAFIDGKIEMVRRDPNMTDEQKAKAIADLEARR